MSRELPPTTAGGPTALHRRSARALRCGLATVVALVISCGGVPLVAHADDTAEAEALNQQLSQSNTDLDEQNQQLTDAVNKAQATHAALAQAQAVLSQAQADRAAAQQADSQAATALQAAQQELQQANAAVVQGLADLQAEQKRAGSIALSAFRGQGQLANWASIVGSQSTQQLSDRTEWNNAMMAQHNQAMADLNAAQRTYEDTAATKQTAETAADTARTAAANALATRQQTETAAENAATTLAAAAQSDDAAQSAAQQAVSDEQARIADLQTQRDEVEKRIQERLAAEAKAAAEAQASAAAKASAEAEASASASAAQASAAAEASAQAQASASAAAAAAAQSTTAAVPVASSSAKAASTSPFIWPVDGTLTSGYGMRLHPILHIWVLHDGQDFGAACGTPIRAAAAGTVVESYFDTTGFGNRLLVDHGMINGTAYTTGYNHAEYYIVSVGQHVEQGQVLGYVGTTGYSTGCHLHLNLWVNGTIVDPMQYL